MLADRLGGQHGSEDGDAVAIFEEAVLGVLAHRPGVAQAIDRVIARDPGFTAAHALQGLAAVVLARRELLAPAAAALEGARAAMAARGGTASERCLVATLAEAVEGRLGRAVALLDARLAAAPHDLLAIKLAHAFRFMLGDTAGMLGTSNAILPAWSASQAGYGFVLGCHAFALEECGEFAAAEAAGRAGVEQQPDDAWGLHAVAHVHEMSGQTGRGIAWLEETRPVWSRCNNFSFHMAWHLALFHLERGRYGRVLELYDCEVRPQPTDDFRDVANAASLLWRLRQEGVPVGDRWNELEAIARRRRHDTTLVFASLHYLLVLLAAGDRAAARELVRSLRLAAGSAGGDQARVAAQLGVDLAEAILALGEQRRGPALGRLAEAIPALGGSGAQRDVLVRTLALLAAEAGDRPTCLRILKHRSLLKQEDRFSRLACGRLAAAQARGPRAGRPSLRPARGPIALAVGSQA